MSLGWILETESSPSLLLPHIWNIFPLPVTIRCSFLQRGITAPVHRHLGTSGHHTQWLLTFHLGQ